MWTGAQICTSRNMFKYKLGNTGRLLIIGGEDWLKIDVDSKIEVVVTVT